MNRNYPESVGGSVKSSVNGAARGSVAASWMKAAFLVAAMFAVVITVSHFSNKLHAAKGSVHGTSKQSKMPASALSMPLFFEPNHGQTDSRVKFLARGSGYGLFLTGSEAVLELRQSSASSQPSAGSARWAPVGSSLNSKSSVSSVIRMKLDGANASARVSGVSPMPGKSSYFIGNDPSKWRRDIPQFARVQYQAVYPGVDLVYYGNQGRLEYDFHVAPSADPNQIAMSFKGATTRIDSGDLVLSTANGDVRFRAPHVYQPAATESGIAEKAIAGSFRQLADNKIGFTVADYDHSRELVIDPILTYSTFLGGGGTEGLVKIAVDSAQSIYVAGSTNSANFPVSDGSTLTGAQNIFISKISPQFAGTGTSQLVYSIYLGGSQVDSSEVDSLGGLAVDSNSSIYVAGSTNSPDFPAVNAFQSTPAVAGTHGFLTRISLGLNVAYSIGYSTYLSGNGTDNVSGVAVDSSNANAYVTGVTTSSNQASDGFPANINGFQLNSNSPGNPQFFASKINTTFTGSSSMLYSTYFGGGNPVRATANPGGIAVDPSGNTVNMYITGGTNMLPTGLNGGAGFPLFNSQQSCLDEASQTSCHLVNPVNADGFVAKINPNQDGLASMVYSTYIGGSGVDTGYAIAVDSSSSAYVTGSTNSPDWVCSCTSGFQPAYAGGLDAFIVKIANNLNGSVYPLSYFTYLGGSGDDIGRDIKVNSVQQAYVVGSTTSPDFPSINPLLGFGVYGGGGDAFVASIGTSLSGVGAGDFSTYLGGNQLDQGSGVAIDIFGATYAAGNTLSPNFPVTSTAYQPTLNGGSQDAFVTQIGAASRLTLTHLASSPSPNPVAAGTQAAFTFNITNLGPDNASNVVFVATVPTTGLSSNATAKVTSGAGTCNPLSGSQISCFIPTLAACTGTCTTGASVEVDVTPIITTTVPSITVSATVTPSTVPASDSQQVNIVNFTVSATTTTPQINAGDPATIQVAFIPTSKTLGYNATITPSQTTSPSMVTSTTPVFNPTPVVLSGAASATTTLSISTVVRPVTTGSLLRRGSFYATLLPIGGLSLIGLGIGAGRRRRRWAIGIVLCLLAAAILVESGCGSSASNIATAGGTLAGTYTITITGSAGTGASQNVQVQLIVH